METQKLKFPKVQEFKLFYDILLIVQSICPNLARISLDLMKDNSKIDRVLQHVNDFQKSPDGTTDVSIARFKHFLSLGFCTGEVLELLYDDIFHKPLHKPKCKKLHKYKCPECTKYYYDSNTFRTSEFMKLCSSTDEKRKIFVRKKNWFYIPSFIHKKVEPIDPLPFPNIAYDLTDKNHVFLKLEKSLSTDNHVSYKLLEKNHFLMNWIPVILHLGCHAFSIKRDGNFFSGTCGKAMVYMFCNLECQVLEIVYSGFNDNDPEYWRNVTMLGNDDFIRNHAVLKHYIVPCDFFPAGKKKLKQNRI